MYPRFFWRLLALPGVMWLVLFVLVPLYAVIAVATGQINFLLQPIPAWNPLDWNLGYLSAAFRGALPGGTYWSAIRNTLVYVVTALALCFAIGYPTAYYIARHARRTKIALLGMLVAPLFTSYLLRMLAWVGLLAPDGYVNRLLGAIGLAHPPDWLNGNPWSVILALTYGYIPFFILPVYASLDRIDRSVIEAARDLGGTPLRTFIHVVLPLSKPGLLAGGALVVLPMFGDYYTTDLISASPRTNMLGNQIDLFLQRGPQQNLGASMVLVMMTILAVAMLYYLYATAREQQRHT